GVERLALRGGGEPGAGLAGHAVAGPGVQRGDVRLLDALLRDVEVAGDARRRGESEGPLATVRVHHGPFGRGRAVVASAHSAGGSNSGRTSAPPSPGAGVGLAGRGASVES